MKLHITARDVASCTVLAQGLGFHTSTTKAEQTNNKAINKHTKLNKFIIVMEGFTSLLLAANNTSGQKHGYTLCELYCWSSRQSTSSTFAEPPWEGPITEKAELGFFPGHTEHIPTQTIFPVINHILIILKVLKSHSPTARKLS